MTDEEADDWFNDHGDCRMTRETSMLSFQLWRRGRTGEGDDTVGFVLPKEMPPCTRACDLMLRLGRRRSAHLPGQLGDGTYVLQIGDEGAGLTESRTTGDAGPTCPLTYALTSDGTSGMLTSGQTCENSVGNTVSFSQGTTVLSEDGSTVSGRYSFTVVGEGAEGPGGRTSSGEMVSK